MLLIVRNQQVFVPLSGLASVNEFDVTIVTKINPKVFVPLSGLASVNINYSYDERMHEYTVFVPLSGLASVNRLWVQLPMMS